MPRVGRVSNAFPPRVAADLVGLTSHMLNYLAREGYVVPSYGRSGTRGKTRYYSYKDLVVARVVAELLKAGLEITRLKVALSKLQTDVSWTADAPERSLRLLVTDGTSLFFPGDEEELINMTARGKSIFAFVLDVGRVISEIKARLSVDQLRHYDLVNRRRIAA